MDIVVLGAGGMGLFAARAAASFPFVKSVLVGDIDRSAADKVAAELGRKGRSTTVDVLNPEQLDAALSGADFVLNTTGPFFTLGSAVLKGAIRSGTHYADICDDWEPTLELLTLSQQAFEKDILAIIGIGASPGVTNLLGVIAAESLDTVDTLLTGWPVSGDEGDNEEGSAPAEPSAAMIHWMQQVSGTIRIKKDGRFGDHKPLQRSEIEYPGFGTFKVWTMGHPEAVTLPLKYPQITYSANVMTGPSNAFNGLADVAAKIDRNEMSLHEAGQHITDHGLPSGGEPGPKISVFAWASGKKNGQPAVAASTTLSLPAGGMGGSTGIPLAVILQLHHQELLTKRGVHAPETCIDPKAYFDALAPLCAGTFSSSKDLVWTTTTFE